MPADVLDLTDHHDAQEAKQAAERAWWEGITKHPNIHVRVLAAMAGEEARAVLGIQGQLGATRDLHDRAKLAKVLAARNLRFVSAREGCAALARLHDAIVATRAAEQAAVAATAEAAPPQPKGPCLSGRCSDGATRRAAGECAGPPCEFHPETGEDGP